MDYSTTVTHYHAGLLSPDECVKMIQFLLDTDKLLEFPELFEVSAYYIMEGLCYYVPSPVE